MEDENTTAPSQMNKDLEEWIEEGHEVPSTQVETEKKEAQGVCEICGKEEAKNVCQHCGRNVCNTCFIQLVGLCEFCIPAEKAKEWKHPSNGKKPDIDWID